MPSEQTVDPLSALAPLFRVRPELQVFCQFGAQWASPHTPEPPGWAPFHLVVSGACVLSMDDRPPVPLQAGDIALLPHGDQHVVHGVGSPADLGRVPGLRTRETQVAPIRHNTDEPEAELICGRLKFEQPHGNLARAALPPLIVLRHADDPAVARLHALLFTIKREVEAAGPGSRAICNDLASAVLLMTLRVHFQRNQQQEGLLRLMTEAQTARAAIALLDDPGRDWSLDEIAAAAFTSRATLVRDFRRLAGTTPLAFLTDLRLSLARHRLGTSVDSIADIAEAAGYQSVAAFSRAFQRRFAIPPGAVRRTRLA